MKKKLLNQVFISLSGPPKLGAKNSKPTAKLGLRWVFFFLLVPFFNLELKAQCYTAPNYCTNITAANNANYGMGIQNVTLYTTAIPTQINNTTTAGTGTQIYFNYTSMIVRALAGDTVYFSVKGGSSNQTLFRIYLDYNNDGTFATTLPELVYTSANLTAVNTIVTGFFIIPTTVTAGSYRVRVASDGQGLIPAPCGPITYSAEYEDYTLLVPASTPDLMSGVITQPASAIVGNNTVAFNFTNISTSTITSVDINYQLDANFPVTQSLTSLSILPGATYTATFTTQIALPTTGSYSLKAWTSSPNYGGNNTPGNDTICKNIVTYCSGPLSGAYTVNPAGSGTTNFKTFGAIDSALMSCGVSGSVTVNVTPGIYNEGLIFTAIPGAGPTKTITFFGNGSTLNYDCNAANLSVVRFQGAKYITLDSLNIKTSNINYGWGVHFYLGSDSNTVRNSTIDISAVTSSTSTNSAGVVFSNSLTSPTTTGITGYRNNIINNYIKGNPSGAGMYYGIVGAPSSAATNVSANRFVNNRIENFYVYGIYWTFGNRTLFRGNTISRPTKTTLTTTYAFYLSSTSRSDTFDANVITNLFGGSPTNTNTTYCFYGINYSGLNTEPNTFSNNLVYNIKGDGPQYGFYFLTSYCNRIYNNTLLFDNTSSTSANPTQALYFTGGTSATSFLDFRNNIVSITRTGTGAKHALYSTGAWTTGTTMNKNSYYSNSSNYNVCNYLGVNYPALSNWKAVITTIDQNSIDYAPNFVNPLTGNFSPRDGAYDGLGDNLISIVPLDITGATRALPMDIGAYEASPIALDAAMGSIVLPVAPYAAGVQSVSAKIRNAGTGTILSATINWSVNGVTQTPVAFSGSLTSGTLSANILLGSVTVASNTMYNIQVWVSSPNGSTDPNPANDQLGALTAAAVSGTVTINSAGSGPGVFTSFTAFSDILRIGGLGGPVVANVLAGSGPYTEQAQFTATPGSSATNTVTINGNGEFLQFNNTDAGNIGIVNLIGTNYFTINNLKIRSLNASYGVGINLTAQANYNKIQNCFIDISSVTGSSLSAGIAITGSLGSPTTTGANGSYNLIENNTITGNSTGGPYYGISYCPTTSSNAANTFNVIRNNVLRDFTVYGFYMMYTAGSMISGNTLSRPTKASPSTFYGFYAVNGLAQDTIENNIIKQPFNSVQTSTGTFYGYYMVATNVPATRPIIIRNNQMYDIKFAGQLNAFYQVSASNLRIYNNTFVVDHAASTSTSTTYLYYNSGTPTTTTIRNNIFFLNRGGSGSKYIYYLATTGAGYVINNNVVHLKQAGTNNFVGYYAANFANLATWKTVNTNAYDQNSVSADPQFRLAIGPEFYQPGTDSVNNIGISTSDVPRDVMNVSRGLTPDPGAYEFSVPLADAGLSRISAPLSPLALGTQNVNVIVKSFGAAALTSADVNWQVNGTLQTPNTWYGYLLNGDSSSFTAGTYTFTNPGFYKIKAWTTNPNSVADSFPLNDTVSVTVCTPLAGTYTVNPSLPATDTNFVSIAAFVSTVQTCGVAGPITVNVAPGIYNGQLTFNGNIPGASAVNNIVINGADSATTRIIHDGSVQRATVIFNGAKNITLRNMSIEASAISGGGFGVLFTNAADSNRIIRCSIKTAILTSALSTFIPVVSTNSLINAGTAGNNGSFITIDSCRLIGGYYGAYLYNNTTPKATDNAIRNSEIIQTYYYPIMAYYQNKLVLHKNKIINAGNQTNISPISMYIYMCDGGVTITKNQIYGQLGGYGMYLFQNNGTSTNRNIIANNMIQLGSATNTSYGIYDAGNVYTDIAHNAVNNTSGDASYVSCAIYFNYAAPGTANSLRLVNNVFSAPNGAMALWCTNTASLSLSSMFINNNVYYSPSSYPFRIVNTIYPALLSYRTAMGVFISGIDTNSVWVQPSFFSSTNLRSITPQLDSMGFVLPTVTDDIDGTARSTNAPDAGVYEFARPGDDAGVISILQPTTPVSVGKNNVKVVIKNFGLNTLMSVNVNYTVGTTPVSRSYSGSLVPGAIDTVTFDSTSGPLGSDQRYDYLGGAVTMKAYTSTPNLVADVQNLNDTTSISFCSALNGVYTINPAGTGTSNFVSFAAAINRLNCGGVTGNVTFNVAPGTYTTQVDITTIVGASDTAKVLFQSSTRNSADVVLTSATATSIDNYTVRLRGANYVSIEKMTIRNTNATYGRVVSINKFTSNNTNTNNSGVKYCILEGINTTSTADQYAIIYGPSGDNATNLFFVGNTIKYGSYGVYLGGQNVISLFSPGLQIDSNIVFQPYWAGVYLLSRKDAKIRNNYIDGNPSYGYYNILLSGASGEVEIANNTIQSPSGTFGLYIANLNYYGEPGLAKVYNNVVNLNSTSTQYGIYLISSSSTQIMNNTIRCASSSTNYAFYHSGNTISVTTPQIVASNNIGLYNNILHSANGYPLYYANANAISGTNNSNNNLYYTTTANFAYLNGTNYAPSTMNTTFRNALYAGSDKRSLLAPLSFTSTTDLKPLVSSNTCWAANGRAQQTSYVSKDVTGATRSIAVATGAPDIGAIEFTPTTLPPAATITGSITGGTSQYVLSFGDTVGKVTWGFAGTLPSAISATYHTGALINDPTNNGNNTGAHYMDVFWRISATGGSFYSYDANFTFDPNMLGTVPSMSDIKLAKKQTGVNGTWVHYGSTLTTVDSVNYNFGVSGLTDFSDFTGTTDLSPLPVKLSRFEAIKDNSNALLLWQTASELNSSRFEIERAATGGAFEKVGAVKAAGNSVRTNSYSFDDLGVAGLFADKHVYYRLKMIDQDGKFEYSPVRMLDFSEDAIGEVQVYPNPFKEQVTVAFSNLTEGNVTVEIVDLYGKLVYKGEQQINASNPTIVVSALAKLSTGVYVIKATQGADVYTRKVVKE
ncbi:MAG: hypothetical protein CFE21_01715 [Bacteroidetes bacterium B1(2017)]|nr:MAG: hypothetical protein CFE21_01715 [Bacteroidetes bacterium B1(2017)]